MNIKEYIQRVYTLEKSCYEQQILINRIQFQLNQANNPKYTAVQEVSSSKAGDMVGGIFTALFTTIAGGIIGFIVLVALVIISWIAYFLDLFFDAAFITFLRKIDEAYFLFPVLIGGGAILGLIFGILACVGMVKAGISDRKSMIIRNRQVAEQNQQIATASKIRTNNLQRQINQAKTVYNQTSLALRQSYDLGVIFPKYHGLVPISMFYEYFASGRCSSLEGHEGAYNIYEQELRMNLILNKLDDIIERLDQIQDSQYMLATAIRESNKTAQQICNAVVNCSDQLENISANTEATKYFSQITAMNTTYMAWFKNYN